MYYTVVGDIDQAADISPNSLASSESRQSESKS